MPKSPFDYRRHPIGIAARIKSIQQRRLLIDRLPLRGRILKDYDVRYV